MADQAHVFEQVTAVLLEMARQRRLILILDDVHWIDESSAGLLFHLARRVDKSQILVVYTYRSEELAFARSEWRHPLPKIVSEIKRQYGEVSVVLGDETPEETREFVEALVDTEPNRLDAHFRDQLHDRTSGHPLFATEMLRNMQERGDLVKDEEGCWITGTSLDWNALPARVEGVLEERIARIRTEVQELLTIASVEGETFTAQVIGRLKQLDERQLLRTLNQELDQHHRLVSEAGIDRVGTTRISQYRFRHQMFRKYFYDALGVSERELLHEDVATVLESLYADRADRIAVQLAHHYDFARLDEKAARFYLKAGGAALGDARATTESLRLRLGVERTPDRIEWRSKTLDEPLQLAESIGDKQLQMALLGYRIYDLVAVGDAAGWSRDLEHRRRIAEDVGEPFYHYLVRWMEVAQSINAGGFAEAERRAGEAHAIGQPLGVDNVDGVLGVQMFTIRREQGRLREVAPIVKHFVEERGAGAAWRPGLALIYSDLEERAGASAEFERLADDGLLRPYSDLTVALGNATVGLGASSRFLGQLAATMAKWDLAEQHFTIALELNRKMNAVP